MYKVLFIVYFLSMCTPQSTNNWLIGLTVFLREADGKLDLVASLLVATANHLSCKIRAVRLGMSCSSLHTFAVIN